LVKSDKICKNQILLAECNLRIVTNVNINIFGYFLPFLTRAGEMDSYKWIAV